MKRAALPLWPVLLPGLALLAAAWRTRRRLPLRALAPALLLLLTGCPSPAAITRVATAEESAQGLIDDYFGWAVQHEQALNAAHPYRRQATAAITGFIARRQAGPDKAITDARACLDAVAATAPGADKVAQTCTDDLRKALVAFRAQEDGAARLDLAHPVDAGQVG